MGFLFCHPPQQVCLYLLLGVLNEGVAQPISSLHSIDPYVFNVTGSCMQLNSLCFDWSVGEMTDHTFATKYNYLLSSGFLQSSYAPRYLYNTVDRFAFEIKVGPNPFNDKIIIQSKVDNITITQIQIIDFEGRIIYNLSETYSGVYFYHEIKIEKLHYPICFLRIQYAIADKIYKAKYLKLIQQ